MSNDRRGPAALASWLSILAVCAAPARTGVPTEWHVPGDFGDLQAALDAAAPGDTILVAPGTYTVPAGEVGLDYGGKDINVMSEAGPWDTILDGQQGGRIVTFENGETPAARLVGFTLTGGKVGGGGGGGFGGGAVSIVASSPTISHCIIRDNEATWGGGLFIVGGAPRIENTIIAQNRVAGVFSAGSAITVHLSFARIRSCTITRNSAGSDLLAFGGAVLFFDSPDTEFRNTVIWGNRDTAGPQRNLITLEGYEQADPPHVTYCLVGGGVPGGGIGNLDADPLFVDWPGGDYNLSVFSPCVDGGDPGLFTPPGVTDLAGDARVIDGVIDIGADESTGLFLSTPEPGIAGGVNYMSVAGTGPNGIVYVIVAPALAETPVPDCGDLTAAVDLEGADTLVAVLSTFHDGVWFSDPIPMEYSGTTRYIQAIDPDDCKVSNLVVKTFD